MRKRPGIEEKIGQLIVMGFHGTSAADPSVRKLMGQAGQGKIGGTILFGYNIESPEQVKELTGGLQDAASPLPLFILADQEGGRVQRLDPAKGFETFLSARKVSETLSRDAACRHYRGLGRMMRAHGFNFDFAPCTDLDGTPSSPVIGGLERSYSSDPDQVVCFAGAMMDGLRQEGIFNCIKHYPGHGRARGDTHTGLVDITRTWTPEELVPFAELIKTGEVDGVMTAHVIHGEEDPSTPATFSEKWLRRLRKDLGFDGLIIPDDLHMGAILHRYPLDDIIIRGLNAGLDLLLFSNNPLAARAQGVRHDLKSHLPETAGVPDEDLPEKIIAIVLAALDSGSLPMARIDEAYARVAERKQQLIHA